MCNIPSPVAGCARYTANCKLNCLSASACCCCWRKYKNKTQHALICIVLPRRTLAMGNNKRAATKRQKKIKDKLKKGKRLPGGSTKENSWKPLKCCLAKELIYVLSEREIEREWDSRSERKRESSSEMNCKLQLKLRLN